MKVLGRHLGSLLALLGLGAAVLLFLQQDPARVFTLVRDAGAGLVLAGAFHLVPMVLNARAWQVLMPGAARPSLPRMTEAVWIRESVNGLLPVARLGGELVSYRLLRRFGTRRAPAAAGLVVDMAIGLLSQFTISLLGVLLLFSAGRSFDLALQLSLGLLAMVPVCAGFVLVQRTGVFAKTTRLLNKVAAGRLEGAIGTSDRIDRAIRVMYRRRGAIIACFFWQLAGWIAGAGELWLALQFLGHPIDIADAIALEAMIQAVSSVAFFVPGALGVQEGAFLLVGGALGLDAPTALALATARRVRDVVVFFPGLLAWQAREGRDQAAAVP